MTDATKPHMRPEAMEAFRYRRKFLTNKRQYWMQRLADSIRKNGNPSQKAKRKLRMYEEQIRAYNAAAEEYGLQPIR